MDVKEVEKLINDKHEEYIYNQEQWKKAYLAWIGGDDFKIRFLWPFEREDEEDFSDRCSRAAYENLFADIINRRQSLVFSRKITRNENRQIDLLRNNADGAGTAREEFVKKCFRLSQIFGFLPVLAERNSTKKEETRLVTVMPFSLVNWSRDEDGSLSWALIQAKPDLGEKGEKLDVYHLYGRETVTIYKTAPSKRRFFTFNSGKLEKDDEYYHGFSRVPLTILYDVKGDEQQLTGRSSLADSLNLVIKLFNLNSWYDQLLYKTNYSTLAATPFHGSSDDVEIVIGAGDVLWVPEGSQMPQWISPDTGPSQVFEERIKDLRRRTYELAGLDSGFKENARNIISGEAFSYQRKPVEEMALRLAKQLEEFENNLNQLILSSSPGDGLAEELVKYPDSYSQKSLDDSLKEIELLDSISSIPLEAKSYLVDKILTSGRIAMLNEIQQQELREIFAKRQVTNVPSQEELFGQPDAE